MGTKRTYSQSNIQTKDDIVQSTSNETFKKLKNQVIQVSTDKAHSLILVKKG